MKWLPFFQEVEKHAEHAIETSQEPLLARLRRSVPVLVAVPVIGFLLQSWTTPDELAGRALDATFRLQAPRPGGQVVLVEIDDVSYQELFLGKSPLSRPVLRQLLEATIRGEPRLIGVDLDTSDAEAAQLRMTGKVPVVWAIAARDRDGELQAEAPLGGAIGEVPAGVTLLPLDSDGVVRRYRPSVQVKGLPIATLPHRIASLANGEVTDPGREYYINFYGDRRQVPRISAAEVLRLGDEPGWRQDSPIRGKVVLLGGTWAESRDDYSTPVGRMNGVELMAQITEAELSGTLIGAGRKWLAGLLQFLSALAVVVVFSRMRLRPALWSSLLLVPLLAVLCSVILFSSAAFSGYFLVPGAMTVGHQLYSKAAEYTKLLGKITAREANTGTD